MPTQNLAFNYNMTYLRKRPAESHVHRDFPWSVSSFCKPPAPIYTLTRSGGDDRVAEWFLRALDLTSGVPWFKYFILPLAVYFTVFSVVLGCSRFQPLANWLASNQLEYSHCLFIYSVHNLHSSTDKIHRNALKVIFIYLLLLEKRNHNLDV